MGVFTNEGGKQTEGCNFAMGVFTNEGGEQTGGLVCGGQQG